MATKSALDKSSFKKEIFFTNSAREGWEVILKSLKPTDKILLPSYIGVTDREGSGIFDPVVSQGIGYEFYALEKDLSISLDLFEKALACSKFKMVLLVHYFGFRISNLKAIIEVCKKNNVQVVEDCAHLYNYNLYNFSDAGSYGDYVFYSLHKNFPFESGGMVVQNNKFIPLLNSSDVSLSTNYSEEIARYDVEAIAKKRIENFKFLDSLLRNMDGIISLKVLSNNDIPHNYPIYVKNGLREKLYFHMIDKGVTLIALYYRLISDLNEERFNEMQDLSNSVLNLPIHQDMSKESITRLVELLIKGISEITE